MYSLPSSSHILPSSFYHSLFSLTSSSHVSLSAPTHTHLHNTHTGKPAPELKWWSSSGHVLQENYFVSGNGISQTELHIPSLNRSNLMQEVVCRASNTNLTQPISASLLIDLNRESIINSSFSRAKQAIISRPEIGGRSKDRLTFQKPQHLILPMASFSHPHSFSFSDRWRRRG